ncbi:MAG: hypothetical protein ACRDOY_06885, partial [Nocardioidaceae bacterium]
VQRAQKMMATAHAQERDIRRRTEQAADVQSVRESTQRAQDQLRSVVATLNEQVERLGEVRESSVGLEEGEPAGEPDHTGVALNQPPTAASQPPPAPSNLLAAPSNPPPASTTTTVPVVPPSEEPSELSDVDRYIRSSSEAFARSWEKSQQ